MLEVSAFGESLTYMDIIIRILTAVFVAGIIGIDRETKNRPAGMRTHILVCVGAMLISMVEQETVSRVIQLNSSAVNISMGRITSTVVSGVGFLGAGTIVLSNRKVSGLTTAASLWCIACIGIAIGAGYIAMALTAGVLILFTLNMLQRIIHINTIKKLEVQFVHRAETLAFLQEYFAKLGVNILDVDFHAETRADGNIYTNLYTLSLKGKKNYAHIIEELSEYQNILTVCTRNL